MNHSIALRLSAPTKHISSREGLCFFRFMSHLRESGPSGGCTTASKPVFCEASGGITRRKHRDRTPPHKWDMNHIQAPKALVSLSHHCPNPYFDGCQGQFANARLPILTPFGNITDSRLLQLENAYCPMRVPLEAIVTDFSASQR